MANELDKGRGEGKVAGRGNPNVRGSDISWSPDDIEPDAPATYEDLGISRQRASEWRDIRDAGEEVVTRWPFAGPWVAARPSNPC